MYCIIKGTKLEAIPPASKSIASVLCTKKYCLLCGTFDAFRYQDPINEELRRLMTSEL